MTGRDALAQRLVELEAEAQRVQADLAGTQAEFFAAAEVLVKELESLGPSSAAVAGERILLAYAGQVAARVRSDEFYAAAMRLVKDAIKSKNN
jgi:hypothetical protein